MKVRDQLGRLESQLRVQTGSKQVVVAVPLPPVIERDDEQVRARECLQLARRTRALGDRITERTVHPVEDRRAQQQLARIQVEIAEHLLAQVVDYVPVIPREPDDEVVAVDAVAQRQSGEIDGCRPAFGALMQRGHVLAGELQIEELVEQHLGFGSREAQLVGIDLDELAAGTEAGNRKRRLGPRRDRDANVLREVIQQPPHPGVDCISLELVVVVEREYQRSLERRELAYQDGKHLVDQVDARGTQERQRPRAEF